MLLASYSCATLVAGLRRFLAVDELPAAMQHLILNSRAAQVMKARYLKSLITLIRELQCSESGGYETQQLSIAGTEKRESRV